jgi:hypothetical protein
MRFSVPEAMLANGRYMRWAMTMHRLKVTNRHSPKSVTVPSRTANPTTGLVRGGDRSDDSRRGSRAQS